jgi:protein-S-isoprenylcysteine O-methyltransferase Ste14
MSGLVTAIWAGFYGYWVLAAAHGKGKEKGAARAEAPGSYLVHTILFVLAFALVMIDTGRCGPLARRFLLDRREWTWAGMVLLLAGLGLAIWARRHLGSYWSGHNVIRADHRVIRNGPYAVVRHPIYAGLVLGMLGTAIFLGQWRGLLAVPLLLLACILKIRKEERWLLEDLGEEYARYRREVRALIPFIL